MIKLLTYMFPAPNTKKGVQVHKVTVAADVGHMINPDTVEAQIQSSIVFGMGAGLSQC